MHGNELVFTAGILNKGGDWLLNFTKRLYKAGTSAFVVNIGPHTKEIPAEVIEYCNKVNMPLFTIPWETRMVDMTRDFCRRIMNNEQVETRITTTMKKYHLQYRRYRVAGAADGAPRLYARRKLLLYKPDA